MNNPNTSDLSPALPTSIVELLETFRRDFPAAEISFSCYDFQADHHFGYKEHKVFHAASTMKLCVVMELFRRVDLGEISLKDTIPVHNTFKSIVDDSIYSVDQPEDSYPEIYTLTGKEVSLESIAVPMITHSSNLATNLLIDHLGADKIQALMESLGTTNLKVVRGIDDNQAFAVALNNLVTAFDLNLALKELVDPTILSSESAGQIIEILKLQHYRKGIPAKLPPEVIIANKTGWTNTVCHDTALVFPANRSPYAITVLTQDFGSEAAGETAISTVSQAVYESLIGS